MNLFRGALALTFLATSSIIATAADAPSPTFKNQVITGSLALPGTGYVMATGGGPVTYFDKIPQSSILSLIPQSAPNGVSQGSITVIGVNAGINLSNDAIEGTFIGESAGGSGGLAGDCIATGGTGLSGVENTGVGWHALTQLTTGGFNTSLGVNALGCLATGDANTAIGVDAFRNSRAISYNVAIGFNAGRNIQSPAAANVFIGSYSGYAASGVDATGSYNTAIGFGTLANGLTTGYRNSIIGYQSGQAISTGHDNNCVGVYACGALTTGTANIANGAFALNSLTTGSNNIAIGHQTGFATTSAAQITAVGTAALFNCTTCLYDTALGYHAGWSVTTGVGNILIGQYVASTTLTTGNNNILIGTAGNCDTPAANTSNYFAVCADIGATPLLHGDRTSTNLALAVNGTLRLNNSASWVAPSNCGSLASSTKCLAIVDPNGNTMYLPAYGTF